MAVGLGSPGAGGKQSAVQHTHTFQVTVRALTVGGLQVGEDVVHKEFGEIHQLIRLCNAVLKKKKWHTMNYESPPLP